MQLKIIKIEIFSNFTKLLFGAFIICFGLYGTSLAAEHTQIEDFKYAILNSALLNQTETIQTKEYIRRSENKSFLVLLTSVNCAICKAEMRRIKSINKILKKNEIELFLFFLDKNLTASQLNIPSENMISIDLNGDIEDIVKNISLPMGFLFDKNSGLVATSNKSALKELGDFAILPDHDGFFSEPNLKLILNNINPLYTR